MNTKHSFIVDESGEGKRFDVFVAEKEEELGRNYVKQLIKDGYIVVNNQVEKPSKKLSQGDEIIVEFKPPQKLEDIEPQNLPIDIIYEDSDVILVNKPAKMVVHPAPGSPKYTLVNALLYHTKDLSGINGILRPGIVHRIDKDTTGILVVAKNDNAHLFLSKQFEEHSINREYIALVEGIVENQKGTIDMPIGRDPNNRIKRRVQAENSKNAVTHFEVLEYYQEGYTLCKFHLETGRTHQIRVHMKEIGHPLVGDPLYNNKDPFDLNGQFLHARKLGFIHPGSEEYIEFQAELPEKLKAVLRKLTPIEKSSCIIN